MAGRPKKMAKRVAELEKRARKLQVDLHRLTPLQYMDRSGSGPEPLDLGEAWRNAMDATLDAYSVVGDLADILRDKAGIEGREPGDELDTPEPTDPAGAESQLGAQPDPG